MKQAGTVVMKRVLIATVKVSRVMLKILIMV